ncbi:uncharacterized protein LOC123685937 isoform X1 [Harmonia axyridis]|uniref:uncharacterized protein LOC123685937 isoform X1 n=1 Tax=Harmonia axyridis TaxID=115357 RepID=UPI001E278E84|nr:uncharacterized protein LOC123685937 isoform X1 [Harmonia axyridis]
MGICELLYRTIFLWTLWFLLPLSAQQFMWTTIYVDANNQIDLWTQKAEGCQCPWDKNSYECACCVEDGGCPCGKRFPNRCAQCGLEFYCDHMCNVSIVSSELKEKSGKSFGQIKSPSLQGPDACSYTFIPDRTERVEIQIYRVVNIGRHNGTICNGGFLQLAAGTEPMYSISDYQICGVNERYSPPVVFYSDDDIATLLMQITEKTSRSQFLAYFSFTAKNNSDGLSYRPKGGMRLQNTDCDWLYQDFACNKSSLSGIPCTLASPGYPGVYPPHRQCKYHITSSHENVSVRISLTALSLPTNCKNDYISIYNGSTRSSPLLTRICGNQRKTVEYSSTNLLLEFSTGSQKPPFSFNGFVANLKFYLKNSTKVIPSTEPSVITDVITTKSTTSTSTVATSRTTPTTATSGCDIFISGNNSRYGYFDSREYEWYPICRLVFFGRSSDVVHISLFNYRLRAPSCRSVIEVIDSNVEDKRNMIERICSPNTKQMREQADETTAQKTYLSTGNSIIITFRRNSNAASTSEAEFLSGAFYFHDEQLSGTMIPKTLCDVRYNGATSPLAGMIDSPGSQYLFKSLDGPLTCRQQFLPAPNQSVTIKVQIVENSPKEPTCTTQCGDHGCRCVWKTSMKNVDYLVLLGENDFNIACLCGPSLVEWLPVSVRTWGPLTILYSIARYNWNNKGLSFSASYSFNTDGICGEHVYTVHSGEIVMNHHSPAENLNSFNYQSCTWILHSNVERQLELDISSTQNRPCTAWNITVHDYDPDALKKYLGSTLYTFCSRDNSKLFVLPWKLNTVVVRLFSISRTLPQFKVKWKSQVIRARYPSSPAPIGDLSVRVEPSLIGLLYLLYLFGRLCSVFYGYREVFR